MEIKNNGQFIPPVEKVQVKNKETPKTSKTHALVEDKVTISDGLREIWSLSEMPQKLQQALVKNSGQLLHLIPQVKIQQHQVGMNEGQSFGPDHPGVYLLSGFKFAGLGKFGGMQELAGQIEGAQHYAWDQKHMVIEQIKGKKPDTPIILIGHGMGSDSALEIANELNGDELGHRKVDLLVTIDSSGWQNDQIPENVRSNLNFLGSMDPLFNDGPNMALDPEETEIENILLPEVSHEEMDEDIEVHFMILDRVSKFLS